MTFSRLGLSVCIACFAWMALSAEARASDPRHIETRTLDGVPIVGVDFVDLDGDGRVECIASSYTEGANAMRKLHLGRRGTNGFVFTDRPVPPDATALCIGSFTAQRSLDVAWIRDAGVEIIASRGKWLDGVQSLFANPNPIAIGDERSLPRWELVRDFDQDGRDELILPHGDGYAIFAKNDEADWSILSRIPGGLARSVESGPLDLFAVASRLPSLVIADQNGDRREDLLLLIGDRLRVHRQRSDGTFRPKPDLDRALAFLGASSDADRVANHWILLEDLDGRGGAEMIVSRPSGKLSLLGKVATRVLVFGDGDGLFSGPTLPLTLGGASTPPALVDLNGDGARDLMVASIEMSLVSNVQKALFKTVDVTYHVFLNEKGKGVFARNPESSQTIGFSLDATQLGFAPLASLDGDFDGDGMPDLVTLTGDDRFCIYRASRKGGFLSRKRITFGAKPWRVLDVRAGDGYRVADWNGDGIADLAVFDRSGLTLVESKR